MKNTGLCPKCEGADILRLTAHGAPANSVLITGLRGAPITRYICSSCGFSEEWIESRADLERLRQKHGLARDDPAAPARGVSIQQQLGLS